MVLVGGRGRDLDAVSEFEDATRDAIADEADRGVHLAHLSNANKT